MLCMSLGGVGEGCGYWASASAVLAEVKGVYGVMGAGGG